MKEKFPRWCRDGEKRTLAKSNDFDSLMGCHILGLKGHEISHFYDFTTLYRSIEHPEATRDIIGVDIDLSKSGNKCWGNHTVLMGNDDIVNTDCANFNVIDRVTRLNYYSKYAGSTTLTIMSYHDFDISQLSEEAKMILLAIDGAYIPFYPWKKDFSGTMRKYLKIMEYEELIEVAERHSKKEFEELIAKYNLNGKINMNSEGYLETSIDLKGLSEVFLMDFKLATDKFEAIRHFKTGTKSLKSNEFHYKKPEYIFSAAVTNKDFIVYSKAV